MEKENILPISSRRSFLQLSTAAVSAIALRIVTEPMLARAELKTIPKDAVLINANENPLGPSASAREAVASIAAQGGRYSTELTDELLNSFAPMEGLKPDYVRAFPGSSEPLHYTVLSYTSPTRSFVTADPGYEAGGHAAKITGARTVQVPLTKNYAHDVKAMLTAAPDAGVFYVCTPNNPTGTLTSHSEIEHLVERKPARSIVLVDEAYIHFSSATSAVDLVRADRDVIVLRTFSKIYGMAGLRCGLAIGRPDLLAKIGKYSGWGAMPITAVTAAAASLKEPQLVPERKKLNARIRGEVFDWLGRKGYAYIPSESNCFMLETKRPAKDVIAGMAAQNVFIGRAWPSLPTHVRVTVGTREEMDRFQAAFERVLTGAAMAWPKQHPWLSSRKIDGLTLPEDI